jgi:hypothetical protein
MQAASVADEVLIQLGKNVQMYIGTREKTNIRVNIKGNAKYVHMYLYKGATTYPCNSHKYMYIYTHLYQTKPYSHICCILDYLNACVLQKRAWPNSINSRKYTKLCYY